MTSETSTTFGYCAPSWGALSMHSFTAMIGLTGALSLSTLCSPKTGLTSALLRFLKNCVHVSVCVHICVCAHVRMREQVAIARREHLDSLEME